jgi:hypothetical protein
VRYSGLFYWVGVCSGGLAVGVVAFVMMCGKLQTPTPHLYTLTDAEGHQLVSFEARDVEVKQLPQGWKIKEHRETAVLKARVKE